MPRIDLAALLIECGAIETEPVVDIPSPLSRPSFGYGIPRYRPPTFARLYAALRFRCPGLFAKLRMLVLIDALQRRPLNPIMF